MLGSYNINFFEKTPLDILIKISSYLHPLDLSLFAKTSKIILNAITQANFLWISYLFTYFPHEIDETEINDKCYTIFTKKWFLYYKQLSINDQFRFSLIRANDLFSITERKITFTIDSLNKFDTQENSLLSLTRKQNNKALNNYIAKNIYVNHFNLDSNSLIDWAIMLDQDDDSFQHLLKDKDINHFYINHNTLLHKAVQHHSPHSVRLLLALGANPNPNPEHPSDHLAYCNHPLHLATRNNDCEIVHLLSSHPLIQINATYQHTYTALMLASEWGHIEIVKQLLKYHASMNQFSPYPLHIAMHDRKNIIVKYLLKHGALTNLMVKGLTPLHIGAKVNNIVGVKALIEHLIKNNIPLNIDRLAHDSSTALYIAAQNGHADMCQFLIDHKAQVDFEFLAGYTPLYIASQNGYLDTIKILCRYKSNVNRISPNGSTALYVAAQNGHTLIVSHLIEQKCNVDFIFSEGYTPLYVACQKGYLDIATTLIMHQANINHTTNRKATPLYVAAQHGHATIVDFLIKNGANVNLRFSNGYTPLHITCNELPYYMAIPIITSLIQAGADPMAYSLNARKPSNVAQDIKVNEIFSLIEEMTKYDISQLTQIEIKAITYKETIIDAISALVKDKQQNDKMMRWQAKNFIKCLSHTFTPFGYIVVLYACLNKENASQPTLFNQHHINPLIQCIIQTLGFHTTFTAKMFLDSIIVSSIQPQFLYNQFKEKVINKISELISHTTKLSTDSFKEVMLCLNFFEAKIKQAVKLSEEVNDRNYIRHSIL